MTRKLYSRKGTLLGAVSYPDEWDDAIAQGREHRFYILPARPLFNAFTATLQETADMQRTGCIKPSLYQRGAVEIAGITLEEFEALPRCAFFPGAAYLRSITD